MKWIALVALLPAALLAAGPPNIVLLYADDMGYGDLGANHPESKIPTPNLDRLAAEGMRFTDGHSSSGICTPSRYAMLTGRHHWRDFHGIAGAYDRSVFKKDQLTLPAMLREKGYATACTGKWHLGFDWDAIRKPGSPPKSVRHTDFDWTKPFTGGPLDHGFDHYFGDNVINFPPYTWIEDDTFLAPPDTTLEKVPGKPKEGTWECRPGPARADWDFYQVLPTLTRKSVEYVRSRKDQEKPFFLFVPFPSPHAPIIPQRRVRRQIEGRSLRRLRGPDRRCLRPDSRRLARCRAGGKHHRDFLRRQRCRDLRPRARPEIRPLVVRTLPRAQAGHLRRGTPRSLPPQSGPA